MRSGRQRDACRRHGRHSSRLPGKTKHVQASCPTSLCSADAARARRGLLEVSREVGLPGQPAAFVVRGDGSSSISRDSARSATARAIGIARTYFPSVTFRRAFDALRTLRTASARTSSICASCSSPPLHGESRVTAGVAGGARRGGPLRLRRRAAAGSRRPPRDDSDAPSARCQTCACMTPSWSRSAWHEPHKTLHRHHRRSDHGLAHRVYELTTAACELVSRFRRSGSASRLARCCSPSSSSKRTSDAPRRVTRLRRASKLPPGKTLDTLDEGRLPATLTRKLHELAEGDFLDDATNVLAFGLPGVGKSHAMCTSAGHALVDRGQSVLFVPTYTLVQELLVAKRDLALPRALRKLDHLAVLLLEIWATSSKVPKKRGALPLLAEPRAHR